MRDPMTMLETVEALGDNFWDSTCSVKCPKCDSGNFFVGQFWDDTVPKSFKCVNCEAVLDGHHPFD